MSPVKCPNCRLSLPQNWSGANDPNAKCPYCGKPLTGAATSTVAPQAQAPSPAPRPASGAKTILWGAGVGIATPAIPKPGEAPQPAPPSVSAQPAASALGTAATQHRDSFAQAVSPNAAPAAEPVATAGSVDAKATEAPAAPVQPATRPSSQPAATVMFQSSMDSASPPQMPQMIERPDSQAPTPEEEAYEEETARRSDAMSSRSKYKPNKLSSKKGARGKAAKSWSTEDDDSPTNVAGKSASKAPIIAAVAIGALALIGTAVYFLRGHGEAEPAKESTRLPPESARAEKAPADEPAALAAKPITKEEFVPPRPVAPEPKPAPGEKARAEKAAHAEKIERAEKADKVERAEVKPADKPSEADYQKAAEAYERGNAKLFQGNTAEAINEFSLALKLNPKDAASHRGLGLAYAQAGKSAEALKQLKAYLKEAPKANDRAIIEKRIEQLRGQ